MMSGQQMQVDDGHNQQDQEDNEVLLQSQLDDIEEKGYVLLRDYSTSAEELRRLCNEALKRWNPRENCPLCPSVTADPFHVASHFEVLRGNTRCKKNFLFPAPRDEGKGWFVTACKKRGTCLRDGKDRQHYHCPGCPLFASKEFRYAETHFTSTCTGLYGRTPDSAAQPPSTNATQSSKEGTFLVRKIDEAHGVYAAIDESSRVYAMHVISRQSTKPGDVTSFCPCKKTIKVERTNKRNKGNRKCPHLHSVEAALAQAAMGGTPFMPEGKVMEPPYLGSVAKGRETLKEAYDMLHCFAANPADPTPLIVEITAATEKLSFRRFSVLRAPGIYERVAVHVPTVHAAKTLNNTVVCSGRIQLSQAGKKMCNDFTCVHVEAVQEALRLEQYLAGHTSRRFLQEMLIPPSCSESQISASAFNAGGDDDLMNKEPEGDLYDVDRTAEVFRLQRGCFKGSPKTSFKEEDPEKKDFWVLKRKKPVNEKTFPSDKTLAYPGDTCLMKDCSSKLQHWKTDYIPVITTKNCFKRRVIVKICEAPQCRAVHSWFGWEAGAHNIANKVILGFDFLHDVHQSLKGNSKVPISSSILDIAEKLEEEGLLRTISAAKAIRSNLTLLSRGVEEFMTLAWLPNGEPVLCPDCGDCPDILMIDVTQKLVIREQNHELADDPDGQTEYSQKEHAKILKMKENAVLLRTMRGTLDYPGLGVGGRFFSAPYISCPGATIYDREREKGSKTSSVPASQGCSDKENTEGSGNSKAVPKHHPSPSSLQEIEDFIAKASARAVTDVFHKAMCHSEMDLCVFWKQVFEINDINAPAKSLFPTLLLSWMCLHTFQREDLNTVVKALCIKPTGSTVFEVLKCVLAHLEKEGFEVSRLLEKRAIRKSGGVLLAICPHGIIYLMKFLRNCESVRDHVDALLSMLNIPYVYVGDLAIRVGAHYAAYKPSSAMSHRQGAAYDLTPENVVTHEKGDLVKRALEAAKKLYFPDGGRDLLFTLFDRFHQDNNSSFYAGLFEANNLLDLDNVNTEVCEQRNKVIRELVPALTMWSPHACQVLMAVMVTIWNCEARDALLKEEAEGTLPQVRCRNKRGRPGMLMPSQDMEMEQLLGEDDLWSPDSDEVVCQFRETGQGQSVANPSANVVLQPDECRTGKSVSNVQNLCDPRRLLPATAGDIQRLCVTSGKLEKLRAGVMQALPKSVVSVDLMLNFPEWESAEAALVWKLYLENHADYRSQVLSGRSDEHHLPTFQGEVPPLGRIIDMRSRPICVLIDNIRNAVLCKGCYGYLGKAPTKPKRGQASAKPPFDLILTIREGYRCTKKHSGAAKVETNVPMHFHFRPRCIRLAFPNAQIQRLHLGRNANLLQCHVEILDFLLDLQKKHPMSCQDWME